MEIKNSGKNSHFMRQGRWNWQILTVLALGLLSSVLWQNCAQPASVVEIPYQYSSEALNNAATAVDGEGIKNNPNLKLNLVYEYAREVLIVLDKEDVSTPWIPLESPQPYILPEPDGAKTLYVKFRNFNKRESDWIELHFVLDTQTPVILLTRSPATLTPERTAEFEINVTDNVSGVATVECHFDEAAFAPCQEVVSIAGLKDGKHFFEVKATDVAGNASPITRFDWTVDSNAPDLKITASPKAFSATGDAQFQFVATDPMSTLQKFMCQLDNLVAVECVSPLNYSALPAGRHTFKVSVTDAAKNYTERTYNWQIDLTKPTIAFKSTPKTLDLNKNVQFVFEAADEANGSGVARMTCQLDSTAAVACTSPRALTDLADGAHTFTTVVYDKAGNSASVSYNFTIDATAPTIKANLVPENYIDKRTAEFQLDITDDGSGIAKIECKADEDSLVSCNGNKTFGSLANGRHTFQFKATDKAGNVTVKNYNTFVDPVRPTEPVFDPMPEKTSGRNVKFFYSSDDLDSGVKEYMCSLDNAPAEKCGVTKSYFGLELDQQHSFKVYAVDKAGNTSTTKSFYWKAVSTP